MNRVLTPTTMETVTGRFIDLNDFKASDLDMRDIAWSLSRLPRYAGHTISTVPYTVGQHSLEVARYAERAMTPADPLHNVFRQWLMKRAPALALTLTDMCDDIVGGASDDWLRQRITFHGLCHDFTEAYLVDLPQPVKYLPGIKEAYKGYESRLEDLIFKTFGVLTNNFEELSHLVVSWADQHALLVEAYHLMPSRGLNWNISIARPSLEELNNFKAPESSSWVIYAKLLARFEELRPKA